MADYIAAFSFLGNPVYWGVLVAAVLVGGTLGMIPGVGAVTIAAIALPLLIFNVEDPVVGLTFIAAIGSLNNTLDSLPAVLLGYPGAATQVTFLEGHQLAMRGKGAHTLGAVYAVSALGGIVGALALLAALPFMRPIIVKFSFPEIAAMAMFGVLMVSALSRGAMIRGIVAGLLGILIGTVGTSVIAGDARYSLGFFYLYDGFPVIPTLLGFFALPELIDLTMRGRPVSPPGSVSFGEVMAGARYGMTRWRMTIRQSIFGVFMGAIPGIGSAVIDWLSYAFGISLAKDKSGFGKGSLEGVLFAESAQNAKEGGQMIPTLAFGVPGGLSQVILLVAMILYGVVPGSGMLDINRHLPVTMAIVATLGIGNLMMTMLALVATGHLAKLTLVPYPLLAAALLPLMFMAAYNNTSQWGDIWVVCIMGVLGLTMKWLGWPRPPLILGFILGPIIERNLWPAVQAFGVVGILSRPLTVGLIVLAVAAVTWVTWSLGRTTAAAAEAQASPVVAGGSEEAEPAPAGQAAVVSPTGPRVRVSWHWDSLFTLILIAGVAWALWTAQDFRLPSSRFLPQIMGIALLPLLVLELLRRTLNLNRAGQIMDLGMRTGTGTEAFRRLVVVVGWIALYILAIGFVSLNWASMGFALVFAWVNVRWRGRKRLWALVPAGIIALLVYVVFGLVIYTIWPEPIFRNWLFG